MPGSPGPWERAEHAALGLGELTRVVATRPSAVPVPPMPDERHSAVLVVLVDGAEGPELLFTRRSMHLTNHRGEVSFPGGRLEPGETAVEAALREASEEVGLDPMLVRVHGELDHLATAVSRSHIVPIVASVERRPALVAQSSEVDRILWVSMADLTRPHTFREERWGAPPMDRPIFFFELDDETIWGVTARIVHQVLRLAHRLDGPEPLAW